MGDMATRGGSRPATAPRRPLSPSASSSAPSSASTQRRSTSRQRPSPSARAGAPRRPLRRPRQHRRPRCRRLWRRGWPSRAQPCRTSLSARPMRAGPASRTHSSLREISEPASRPSASADFERSSPERTTSCKGSARSPTSWSPGRPPRTATRSPKAATTATNRDSFQPSNAARSPLSLSSIGGSSLGSPRLRCLPPSPPALWHVHRRAGSDQGPQKPIYL
mmetsp:Transcript_49371/g.140011  ORF Transcript_49371/g.140011 Transcript_49371/m.140011 type:complete len:221 (-) Transcript_49371:13-675(-)